MNLTTDVENFLRHLPEHKAELQISHNQHLGVYETVAQWIEFNGKGTDWCSEDSKARAIEANEFWELFWNPKNPVSSYSLCAHTLVELLQAVKEAHDEHL